MASDTSVPNSIVELLLQRDKQATARDTSAPNSIVEPILQRGRQR